MSGTSSKGTIAPMNMVMVDEWRTMSDEPRTCSDFKLHSIFPWKRFHTIDRKIEPIVSILLSAFNHYYGSVCICIVLSENRMQVLGAISSLCRRLDDTGNNECMLKLRILHFFWRKSMVAVRTDTSWRSIREMMAIMGAGLLFWESWILRQRNLFKKWSFRKWNFFQKRNFCY